MQNLLFSLWDNFMAFTIVTIMASGAMAGLGSRSWAVGSFAAYLVFVRIATQTGDTLLINILYVTLVVIIMGMGFKLWRLEFGGSGGGT